MTYANIKPGEWFLHRDFTGPLLKLNLFIYMKCRGAISHMNNKVYYIKDEDPVVKCDKPKYTQLILEGHP